MDRGSRIPRTLTRSISGLRRTFHSSNCSAVSKASHEDATVRRSRFGKGFVVRRREGEKPGARPSPPVFGRVLVACRRPLFWEKVSEEPKTGDLERSAYPLRGVVIGC
jgi:hypothetical protein